MTDNEIPIIARLTVWTVITSKIANPSRFSEDDRKKAIMYVKDAIVTARQVVFDIARADSAPNKNRKKIIETLREEKSLMNAWAMLYGLSNLILSSLTLLSDGKAAPDHPLDLFELIDLIPTVDAAMDELIHDHVMLHGDRPGCKYCEMRRLATKMTARRMAMFGKSFVDPSKTQQ